MKEQMENVDTTYENVLARLPKSKDEDEVRITRALQAELLTTTWARETFDQMRQLQIDFFRYAITQKHAADEIFQKNQELLKALAQMAQAEIVSGSENLTKIERAQPAFIVSNHLGDYKLCAIKPEELGIELPVDLIHPFPMYYAPYQPIADQLGNTLLEAHIRLLEPLFTVEKACGLATIVTKEKGGLNRLEAQTQELFVTHASGLMVVFPEGGTTGKKSGGGPYDLEEFHAGAFTIAGHLGIPIIPVAKYFDPVSGYKLSVLPSIKAENNREYEYYKSLADNTQSDLQEALDQVAHSK